MESTDHFIHTFSLIADVVRKIIARYLKYLYQMIP